MDTISVYDSDNNTICSIGSEKEQNPIDDFESNLTIGDFERNLVINDIEFHLELQEYPRTSDEGVACVYNVSALDQEKSRNYFSLKNLQYAVDSVTKNMRKCHGVKMCSHSAEELNSSHVSVDFETNVYKNIYNTYEHSIEKYTLNFFVSCFKISCQFINQSNNTTCDGHAKLYQHKTFNESNATKYFIRCSKWKKAESHRYIRIPLGVNITYLQELFQNYNVTSVSEANDIEVLYRNLEFLNNTELI
ncbi:unnamed protein product [Rhizophagus irregularis]|nr:unnamed protein product [Rhizophagus irregularis]